MHLTKILEDVSAQTMCRGLAQELSVTKADIFLPFKSATLYLIFSEIGVLFVFQLAKVLPTSFAK